MRNRLLRVSNILDFANKFNESVGKENYVQQESPPA